MVVETGLEGVEMAVEEAGLLDQPLVDEVRRPPDPGVE
jgi:hypothetical protein